MLRKKDVDPCENYPIQIHYIKENNVPGYFFAFHPDFGTSSCSATGDTIPIAIMNLAKVRADIMCFLRATGRPIPVPSANPLDSILTKRCFLNCVNAGPLMGNDGTTKCTLLDKYHKVGEKCPRPLEARGKNEVDNHWICVRQCEKATVLEYKNPQATFIKCGKDGEPRSPNTPCPHPESVRKMRGKLDPATKLYLRAIRKLSKELPNQRMFDLADEIAVTAIRLRRTTAPEYRQYYQMIDTMKYAVRVGALTLKLLLDHVDKRKR